ncbi:MAG: nitrate reductase [Bdellovibrionales bacterium RIFOXYC1_FULL_54_43]|nr:MAG: nitrate reductase [Bdellovibrionales bacterium RIFOXYC1_FULL_54_43]OFZ84693.1 MAG: nitrate reductase [Bdellovibrionales bacterium RIFOXYD1_FULL_55_31]
MHGGLLVSKKYTRREFIKISALGTGALAVGSGLMTDWWSLDRPSIEDPKTDGDRIVPTFCEVCFWKCGVLAHVRNGRITKLTGNPNHPLSNGKLCPRGAGGVGMLYDPDRLKKPLIRSKKRGEDVFVEVDWNTALDKVAHELKAIRQKYGPEALALFSHGCGGSWFTQLMKAYGSSNIGAPSYAQCRGPREAGYSLTFGQSLGSPESIDIAHARCITLIGSHLGENMHNTQVQELAAAIDAGAQLVVVDPRFSVAAGKARYWLPIKPGTDIALLLAWMNVLIEEKRYDVDYIREHATGFDELKAHVADKTPEWAFGVTGLEPKLIRDSLRLIASARPASLIHPGRHTTWYGDDTQRARAMAILAALLGSYGRRGGYISSSKMPIPAYSTPSSTHKPRSPADRPKSGGFPVADEVLASGLRQASIPGTAAYDIKGWLVYGTNLMQSLPNPKETIEAIQHLDFIATIDTMPAEICGWSDVVLPECTYLEREDDLYSAQYQQPFVAIRQEVVPPLHDSKPGWWIAKELAARLGLGAQFPWHDARVYLRKRAEAGGLDWTRLEKSGVVLGKRTPVCEEEGLKPAFGTESRKIELFSAELKTLGADPLPNFYPPEEPPPGMFRLLSGRSPVHTFGRTTNNQLLLESFPENEVWINTAASKAISGFGRALKNGDKVRLVNQDGARSMPVKVKVTERIRGDCVYLVHGFGHTSKGLGRANGRGASDSELTTRYKTDPLMGGTGMNVNFVRIENHEG